MLAGRFGGETIVELMCMFGAVGMPRRRCEVQGTHKLELFVISRDTFACAWSCTAHVRCWFCLGTKWLVS